MWQRVKGGQNLRMLSADVWLKDGCANNSCHVHYQSRKLLSFSIIRFVITKKFYTRVKTAQWML